MGAMGFGASDAGVAEVSAGSMVLSTGSGSSSEVASFGLARLEEEVKEQILSREAFL
jgi:hypothetical protein